MKNISEFYKKYESIIEPIIYFSLGIIGGYWTAVNYYLWKVL